MAVNDVFARVADGYEYPKDKCPCGCGIDKAGTAITHAMLARMVEIDQENVAAVSTLMQKRYAMLVQNEMRRVSKTNKEFIKMNRPPLSERSPVLRGVKKLWTSLR
jgi:predicted RNA methylase